MSDCRFGVSPVNYPDPDPDHRFMGSIHILGGIRAEALPRSFTALQRPHRMTIILLPLEKTEITKLPNHQNIKYVTVSAGKGMPSFPIVLFYLISS